MTPAGPNPLFELALYLTSCSRMCFEEPVVYGSFRLIEGASRLIAAASDLTGAEADAFLREARAEIDREKLRMIDDGDGYREWLTGFLARFAEEATRRNLALPADSRV